MHLIIANLTSGGMSGGSRKYLERMLPQLDGHSRISRLEVIVPPDYVSALRDATGVNSKTISTWPAGDERRGFKALESQLQAARPSVVLIPSTRILHVPTVPVVVMMRNMEPPLISFWQNPIGESLKNIARLRQSQRACSTSDHVIAVSDFVQRYLVEKWKVPSEKITRIYHGAEAPLPRAEASRPAALPDSIAAARLLFTAGSIRPARGLTDLIRAIAIAEQKPSSPLQLVIAGAPDPGMEGYAARLKRLAKKLGVNERIHWVGSLSRSEMSWCYYQCAAFVMTSRAEACPNVALEAMVHGCPIVSVDTPPMPEFFPTVTRYYSSGNSQALAAHLLHCCLVSQSERARWQAAALIRGADFSWQRTAQATVALMSSLVRQRREQVGKAA